MNHWKLSLGLVAYVILTFPFPAQAQTAQQLPPAAAAQEPVKPMKPVNPIDAYAWLIGGVWTADASSLAPGLRIETRYSWSDNHTYIRFTTHFVSTQGTLNNYDGDMYWDAARKQLRMWYMSASGQITECPMTIDGDRWRMEFEGTDFDDKPATLQVLVDRKSNDLYHWSLSERARDGSEKAGEGWKPLAGLDYLRK